MTNSKRFSGDDLDSAKAWDLPFVEDEHAEKVKETRTNAINRRSDWKYEPPEEEEEILPPTLEEIEAIRQAARDEGYAEGRSLGYEEGHQEGVIAGQQVGHEEGLAAGLEEGKAQGKEEVEQAAKQWATLSDTLHAPLAQVNDDTRNQLVRLAVTLARAVVRTEIKTNEDVILQALSEGLKTLPINETRYQFQMHPEDIELIKSHFGEETVAEKNWHFVEAPGMSRGGCDITTTQNAVDVSIERRSRDVLDRFLNEQGLADD